MMNRLFRYALALASVTATAAVVACGGDGNVVPGRSTTGTQPNLSAIETRGHTVPHGGPASRVCADAPSGFGHCTAWRRTDIGAVGRDVRPGRGRPSPKPSPTSTAASGCTNPSSGYTPCDLRSAYNLTATGSSSQMVGIVDAYDDPNAEADLAVYRSQFNLTACTSANGCFRKLNQSGVQGNYPNGNSGWAQEISLDLDMASAICPNCRILLVEGNSNSFADLAAAVNTAVSAGATVVSNSYGGNESSSVVSAYGPAYSHAGVTITASTGDSGFSSTAQFPADLNSVAAVGGTSLTSVSPRTESGWSGAGSGCSGVSSSLTVQPTWEAALSNITRVCSRRAYADVSADADPNTGVDVYDSYHASGWLVFGGTSVASPIIASVYALAGNAGSAGPAYPYSHTSSLNDVTSGSNGSCGTDLCNATSGWDGPTGLGSPNGTGAF